MGLQMCFRGEFVGTFGALKWPFSGMCSNMSFKVAGFGELFQTLLIRTE